MRAQARVLGDLVEKTSHDFLNPSDAHALARARQKHSRAINLPAERSRKLIALALVVSQRKRCVITHGKNALLPSLPAHFHLLAHGIDVLPVEPLELREAHPGRVEQLEDCRVA